MTGEKSNFWEKFDFWKVTHFQRGSGPMST